MDLPQIPRANCTVLLNVSLKDAETAARLAILHDRQLSQLLLAVLESPYSGAVLLWIPTPREQAGGGGGGGEDFGSDLVRLYSAPVAHPSYLGDGSKTCTTGQWSYLALAVVLQPAVPVVVTLQVPQMCFTWHSQHPTLLRTTTHRIGLWYYSHTGKGGNYCPKGTLNLKKQSRPAGSSCLLSSKKLNHKLSLFFFLSEDGTPLMITMWYLVAFNCGSMQKDSICKMWVTDSKAFSSSMLLKCSIILLNISAYQILNP